MAMNMHALCRAQRTFVAPQHAAKRLHTARMFAERRAMHQTSVVLKKSKQNTSESLFEDSDDGLFPAAEEEDLFASSTKEKGKSRAAKSTTNTTDTPTFKGKLSPEERLERFDTLFVFLSDRIGKNPPAKARREPEQVRKTAWQHLFGLATTAEQLERVTELFPKWRESRKEFTPRMVEAFVRRCEELHCPTLAVKVFSDHPKYGFDLTDLRNARQLLHSLHLEHSLDQSITLSALYRVYKLPAISSDLVSCALLTAACFKAKSEEASTVANALIPELRKLLDRTKPEQMAMPAASHAKNKQVNREKTWLRWTLLKVEKALEARKEPVDWLRQWREACVRPGKPVTAT